jgi:hypothetical protein
MVIGNKSKHIYKLSELIVKIVGFAPPYPLLQPLKRLCQTIKFTTNRLFVET